MEGQEFKIPLGAKVRNKTTGTEGTVTARIEYLYSGNRYEVEGKDPSGRAFDSWAYEGELEATADAADASAPTRTC